MVDQSKPESRVIVLASGGLDSTACIAYYCHHKYLVELLWVNYGQEAAKMESRAVRRIAKFYKAPLQTVSLKGLKWRVTLDVPEYLGRNAILALLGTTSLHIENGLVAMGIHSGTDFVDCSETFQSQIEDMIELLSHGLIKVDFPFGRWRKQDIAQFCVQYSVPVELTYSCLRGTTIPCGTCASCKERRKLYHILGDAQ